MIKHSLFIAYLLIFVLVVFPASLVAQYLEHPTHYASHWATLYRYEGEHVPKDFHTKLVLNRMRPILDESGLLTHVEFSAIESISYLFHFRLSKGIEVYFEEELIAFIPAKALIVAYQEEVKAAELCYIKGILAEKASERLATMMRASGSLITTAESFAIKRLVNELQVSNVKELYGEYTLIIDNLYLNISRSGLTGKRKEVLDKTRNDLVDDLSFADRKLKISGSLHKDYLKGKRKSYHLHQSSFHEPVKVPLTTPVHTGERENFSAYTFVFTPKKAARITASIEPIMSKHKGFFRVVEDTICHQLERLFIRKEIPNRYRNAMEPMDFKPRLLKETFKTRIYFEKGKSVIADSLIEHINSLQRDSDFRVHSIHIKGYASIEGDSLINTKLMQERAAVFLQFFSRYQEDQIGLEMEFEESWDQFYEQIAGTDLDTLRAYTPGQIRIFLADRVFQASLEPLLSQQRKAELIVYLIQKPSKKGFASMLEIEYMRATIKGNEQVTLTDEAKMNKLVKAMGIRALALKWVKEGKIDSDLYFFMLNWEDSIEQLLAIYELIGSYQTIRMLPGFDLRKRVLKLYENWHFKASNTKSNQRFYPYLLNAGLDLSDFIYGRILDGELDISILCSLRFPKNGDYSYMQVREWDFIEYAETRGIKMLSCFDLWMEKTLKMSPEEIENLNNVWQDNEEPYRKKIYSFKYRVFYDYFTKELSKGLQRYQVKEMYEFDIAYMLYRFHLPAWIPEDSHNYNVNSGYRNAIGKLVLELQKHHQLLCSRIYDRIMLDFHSRNTLLAYTEQDLGPDRKPLITPIESIDYLKNYVKSHLEKHSPEELLEIVSFLSYTQRQGNAHIAIQEGYELLKKAMQLGNFNGETIAYIKKYGPLLDVKWLQVEAQLIDQIEDTIWFSAPSWPNYLEMDFISLEKTQKGLLLQSKIPVSGQESIEVVDKMDE